MLQAPLLELQGFLSAVYLSVEVVYLLEIWKARGYLSVEVVWPDQQVEWILDASCCLPESMSSFHKQVWHWETERVVANDSPAHLAVLLNVVEISRTRRTLVDLMWDS